MLGIVMLAHPRATQRVLLRSHQLVLWGAVRATVLVVAAAATVCVPVMRSVRQTRQTRQPVLQVRLQGAGMLAYKSTVLLLLLTPLLLLC